MNSDLVCGSAPVDRVAWRSLLIDGILLSRDLDKGILREGDTWCLMLDDEVFLRTTRVGSVTGGTTSSPAGAPTRLTGGGRSPRILAVLVVNRVR